MRGQFGKILFLSLMALVMYGASPYAQSGPSNLNISGGLFHPTGQPVLSTSVNFLLEIRDKTGACVLYSERHDGVDLSSAKGRFSFEIGDGTSASNFLAGTAVFENSIFKNAGATGPFPGCPAGVTLANGDERVVRISYDLGGGLIAMQPDVPVVSSAYSMVAETLQGRSAADFVQLRDDVNYDLNQTNVETVFSTTNLAKLIALLSGNMSNQTISNVAAPTNSNDAATKGYADTNVGGRAVDFAGVGPAAGNGRIVVWDQPGNKWTTISPSSLSDATKLPLAGGTLTGNLVMAPQTTISLGTYTDAQEPALIATLGPANAGVSWYNTDDNVYKIWSGTAAIPQAYLTSGKLAASWIPNTTVGAGSYGSATQVPTFTVGADGRLTTAGNVTIAGVAPGGNAGGDLTGTYPSPLIATGAVVTAKIANEAITSAKLNNTSVNFGVNRLLITDGSTGNTVTYSVCNENEVLRYTTATGWACTNAATLSAVVSVNGKTGAVVLNANDLSLGTASLKDYGTNPGELVELDGGGKIPSALMPSGTGTVTNIATGTGLVGGPISSTGTISLSNTGVSAGTYGSATAVPVFSVDAQGRVSSVANVTITGAAPTGSATGDLSGSYPSPVVASIQGSDVSETAPTTAGQVLRWNALNLEWEASTDGSALTALNASSLGSGTVAVGRLPALTGDVTSASGTGALYLGAGVVGPTELENTSVTVGTYGTSTSVAQFSVDAQGRITGATNVTITGAAPTGAASGDLSANFPNPMVARLQGSAVSATAPSTAGQVLRWNGSQWEASTDGSVLTALDASNISAGTLPAGRLPAHTGDVTSNAGSAALVIAPNAVDSGKIADGTVSSSDLTTTGVSAATYGTGTQVPQFSVDAAGRITGVTNVTITGAAPTGAASGDLSANFPNPTVAKLQGSAVSATAPSTAGQVLRWNGSQWEASTDGSELTALDASNVSAGTLPAGRLPAHTGDVTSTAGSAALTIAPDVVGPTQLASTSVAAGTYGTTTHVPQFAVDADGRITGVTPVAISGVAPSFPLNGPSGTAAAPTYSFTDNDNGIFLAGADALAFSTAGTERLRVTADGAVAIGTTTPEGAFQVTKVFTGASGDQRSIYGRVSSNTGAGVTTATTSALVGLAEHGGTAVSPSATVIGVNGAALNSWTSTVGQARGVSGYVASVNGGTISNAYGGHFMVENNASTVTNGYGVYVGPVQATNKWSFYAVDATAPSYFAGNVGVGTSTPASVGGGGYRNIHIHDTGANASGLKLTNNTTGATLTDGLELYSTGTGGALILRETGNLTLGTNSTTRVTIDGDGKVGVGATPVRAFHVAGTDGIRIAPSTTPGTPVAGDIFFDSAANNILKYYNGSGWQSVAAGGADNLGNHSASQNVQLGANWLSGDGNSEGIFVDGSGLVGIGRSNPAVALDVAGSVHSDNSVRGGSQNAANPTFSFKGDDDTGIFRPSADALGFATAGTERLSVLSNGNVGIGTTTPLYPLDIRTPASRTQLHLSGTGNDDGGYLFGYSTDHLYSSAGAAHNGTNWIAKAPLSAVEGLEAGTFSVYLNSGLTAGNTFSPSLRFKVTQNGGSFTDSLAVGSEGATPIAKLQVIESVGGPMRGILSSQFSSNGVGAAVVLTKARGTYTGVVNSINNGDYVGVVSASPYDGTSYLVPAFTGFIANGAVSTGTVPVDFVVNTGSSGTAGGTERLRVTSGGKVGIATTAPARAFHVAGTDGLRLEPSVIPGSPAAGDIIVDSGASNTLKYHNGSGWQTVGTLGAGDNLGTHVATTNIQLGSNWLSGDGNNEGLFVDSTGRVGIGTSAPVSALNIGSTAGTLASGLTFAAGDAGIYSNTDDELILYAVGANRFNISDVGIASISNGGTFMKRGSGLATSVSFGFVGDEDTGMYGTGAGVLRFATEGSDRMTIGSTGNIGIGTTTPSAKVEVIGETRTTSLTVGHTGTAGAIGLARSSDGAVAMGFGSYNNGLEARLSANWNAGYVTFFTNDGTTTERMRITSTGYVGIGTTSPARSLHVEGTDGMRLAPSALPGAPAAGDIIVDSAANNTLKFYNGSAWVSASGGSPSLWTDGGTYNYANNATDVVVTDAGRIGIGTTAPNRNLHVRRGVAGTNASYEIGILEAASSGDMTDEFGSYLSFAAADGGANLVAGTVGAVRNGSDARGALVFATANSGLVERMRIDSLGSLGLGTTAPARKLHIEGTDGMRLAASALPASPAAGDIVIDSGANNTLKFYNGSAWVSTGASSGVTTMAAVGSSPNANGASISGSTLTLQPASGTMPGVLTTGAQTIAGDKTYSGQISAKAGSDASLAITIGNTNTGFHGDASGVNLDVGGLDAYVFGSADFVSYRNIRGIGGDASAPGFSFHDDNDTGILAAAANTIAISTAGTERIRVDATGRLGIGTTTPTAGVHVAKAGAASAPGLKLDGAWFSGGSSTTTKPQLLIEPAGTASTTWSTNGTALGVNAPGTFTGSLLDLKNGDVSQFSVGPFGGLDTNQTITLRANSNATFHFGPGSVLSTNGDVLGRVVFNGVNSTWGPFDGGSIRSVVTDVTAGSEDTTLSLQTAINGSVADRLTIYNGNVGLGTTAPARTLHVAGTVGMRLAASALPASPATGDIVVDSGANNTLKFYNGSAWVSASGGPSALPAADGSVGTPSINFTNDTDMGLYRRGADILGVVTAGTERLSILANGNVGVGTTSPARFVQAVGSDPVGAIGEFIQNVDDNAERPALALTRQRSSTTAPGAGFGPTLRFQAEGASNNTAPLQAQIHSVWETAQTNNTTARDGALIFSTSIDDSSNERMRITSTGNVGIGTTNPGDTLTVAGSVWGDVVSSSYITSMSAGAAVYPGIKIDATTTSGQSEFIFQRSRGTVYGSPSAVLDGDSMGALIGRVWNGTQEEDGSMVRMTVDGTNVTGAGSHPGGRIEFITRGTTDPSQYGIGQIAMTIRNSGYVGIGTTNPSQALEVNGTIAATDLILTSDARAKRDVQSLVGAEALRQICAIRPVAFRWNSSGKEDQGVIAQEVREIFPQFVVESEEGALSVKYQSLISPMIASIQELNKKQELIEAENRRLADENQDLKKRLEKLEQIVNKLDLGK